MAGTHMAGINSLAASPFIANFGVVRQLCQSLPWIYDHATTEPQCLTGLHIRYHWQIKRKPNCQRPVSVDKIYVFANHLLSISNALKVCEILFFSILSISAYLLQVSHLCL
jgi:hypothetical protein